MDFTVTTTPQEAIPAERSRALLWLENNGASDIWISPRPNVSAAGANGGIRIKAGDAVYFDAGNHPWIWKPINAICASGTCLLSYETITN
jgi:hypothetical protein